MKLNTKVLQELADSTKGFGDAVDSILSQYNLEDLQKNDLNSECLRYEINAKLSELAVVLNQSIEEKLEELCKKHY